ncbi:MAG: hypothetical protein GXP53_12680 [Deltaproteobacteria bacterium]|nr:hypothetical protein [Deltaproteobacteria bacterium]
MATMDEDGGIGAEVSDRLDELFGEDDGPESDAGFGASASSPQKTKVSSGDASSREKATGRASGVSGEDSPIKELKALVFGIDWEITDESMVSFLKEVKKLQKKYQGNKIHLLFLKLHESIGKYIRARKVNAHPDALKFVASVFTNFEKVLMTSGMSEIQKKRLLSGEVKKFKDFKERVISREQAMGAPMAPAASTGKPTAARPALSGESQATIDYIVGEIKKTIREEFQTLRQLLKK